MYLAVVYPLPSLDLDRTRKMETSERHSTDAKNPDSTWRIEVTNTKHLYGTEHVDALKNALASAPAPARKMTKKELIQALLPDLNAARSNGHNVQSLCAVLDASGVKTTPRQITQLMRVMAPIAPSARTRKE